MNRRDFLKALGFGAVAAATPKLIFDMGANLWKPEYQPDFPEGWTGEIVLADSVTDQNIFDGLFKRTWERRLFRDINAECYLGRFTPEKKSTIIIRDPITFGVASRGT